MPAGMGRCVPEQAVDASQSFVPSTVSELDPGLLKQQLLEMFPEDASVRQTARRGNERRQRLKKGSDPLHAGGLFIIFSQMFKDFKCFTRIIVGFDHHVKAQPVSLLLQAAPQAQYSIRLVRWRTAMNFLCRDKDGFSRLCIGRITADL